MTASARARPLSPRQKKFAVQMGGPERSVDCRTDVQSDVWHVVASQNDVRGVDEANSSVHRSLHPRSARCPAFLAFLRSKQTSEYPDERPDERLSAWGNHY